MNRSRRSKNADFLEEDHETRSEWQRRGSTFLRDRDFPIQNLPYGVFADASGVRCGIAIGDSIFDLARAEGAGLFTNTGLDRDSFRQESLNAFLGHSRGVWSSVRSHIAEVLESGNTDGREFCEEHRLVIEHPVQMRMPIEVGDYVDFYSSEQHATNVGEMFRPGGDALLPNWKHMPVGYHGKGGNHRALRNEHQATKVDNG